MALAIEAWTQYCHDCIFLYLNFQQKVFISSVLFGLHISFRDCPVRIYVYSMHRRRSTFFYYNLHSSIWAAMIKGRIYFCCRDITKGPSINYVVSKSAIFDSLPPPPLSSFLLSESGNY